MTPTTITNDSAANDSFNANDWFDNAFQMTEHINK